MSNRMRLVSLFAVLAIAVAVLALGRLDGTKKASADIQAGNYSLEAETGGVPNTGPFQTTVAVGGSVTVHERVDFTGGGSCTGAAGIFGCYQAAQWRFNYNSAVLSTTLAQVTKDGAAPAACTSKSLSSGPDFVLTGCLDLSGANLNYSGAVWNIVFTCTAAGVSPISLEPDSSSPGTFINDGVSDGPEHYHINDDNTAPAEPNSGAIVCVNTADITATKTGPANNAVNAGGAVQYVVTATNTGPSPWIGGIVTDDLPDNADVSGCSPGPATTCATVAIDQNGDSTAEIGPVPGCIFFAAFPNPFPIPPAVITNLVICPAAPIIGASPIAVNGKMIATINVAASPDDCNDTYIDLGAGLSDSPTAPNFGVAGVNVDPDFLDGVDGTEDNFAPYVHKISDCPVTITKTGPAGGITGDLGSYTITVTNAGPSNATSVVVTDNVPAGLTINSVVGTGCGFVGQLVTCNIGTLAPGNSVITVNFTESAPGSYCNTANVSWTRGNATQSDADDTATAASTPTCFTVLPPFNGLVKAVDLNGDTDTNDPGEAPGQGETTVLVNLWLCANQATDGIDNNGDSTVDNEPATCLHNGEGDLDVSETIFTRADCDTRNDDDDGDGEPVSNDPNSPGFRPECPQPTLQDYIDDNDGDGNGNVDKNGGEIGEGLGAFEFQLKFDHKIFDITITQSSDWTNGRPQNCSMTLISENDIRWGCITTATYDATNSEDGAGANTCGDALDNGGDSAADSHDADCYDNTLGFQQVSGNIGANIHIVPDSDIPFRVRPGKDNGIVRRLLDENCEVADVFGDIFPNTNAGLTPDCTDIDITVRRLEGDIDMDCDVDVTDSQRIAFRYGSFFGQLLYDTFYDLEPFTAPDFDVDIKDLQFVFGRIGSSCTQPVPNNQNPLSANGVGQP